MSKLETGLHYSLKLDALPPNWKVGYVGDFADAIQPGFASGKHNKEGAGIPHIRPFNIDRQGKLDLSEIKSVAPDSDAKRLHTGDVLFNNTNSPELIGKTAVIASAGDWGFSNHMTRIRFKDDVAPKFAAYQLHFLWMTGYFLHNCVKHVNQASISSKTLANAVPFIAPPLDQQKRIVAEIEKQFSRLDEAVANLKRVKANLKRYKAAVLKAAVEGRLVETEAELAHREGRSYETGAQLLKRILETRRSQWKGKGKYKEPAAPDTSDLPELPEGWAWLALNQFAFLENGDRSKNYPSRAEFVDEGVHFINAGHLEDGRIDMAEMNFISEERFALLRAGKVREDDLLFCLRGSLGKVAIVSGIDSGAIASSLVIVRPTADVIPGYLLCYFMSPLTHDQIQLYDNGSAQPNLSAADLGKFVVPIPPVATQRQIVAEVDRRLSLLRVTEAQMDANLQRAERLRQSVLQRAFTAPSVGNASRVTQ